MHKQDILAEALRWAGLSDMAEKAFEGWYHDPRVSLAVHRQNFQTDLQAAKDACKDKVQSDRIDILMKRHLELSLNKEP